MKHFESFDLWKSAQTKSNQSLIQALRKIVNSLSLPLAETVKWGNGCWVKNDLPIVYIYAGKKSVQLGFFAGSLIPDPKGILEGKGKFVRFITIHTKDEIDSKSILGFLKKAIRIKYK